MYGLLIESIIEIIKAKYGDNIWDVVRKKAKLEYSVFNVTQQYSETVIQRIVKHLAEVTGQSTDSVMDFMGDNFIKFFTKFGYERILRVLGRHMRDFLNGLDNLHEYMRFTYPKAKPPSFFVEQETSNGLILHYRTKRKGFIHYVIGQIRQVGKLFYDLNVQIEILSEKQEMDIQHVVFQLTFENAAFSQISNSNATSDLYFQNIGSNLPIRSEIFFELFPFHVVFKRDLEILSVGESLKQAIKHVEGEGVRDVFNLVRPMMNFTWENVMGHTNNVFELTTIEPVRRSESPTDELTQENDTFIDNPDEIKKDSSHDDGLKLRGQMMYIEEWDSIIFLASPILENLDVMFQTGFYINDLSMHDSSRDLVLVGTQQSAELKLALDQEKQKSKALSENMRKLDIEIKRTDQLLYQMIPKKIADRLRSGEAVMNICEVFTNCTILFSDVVGFTTTCSQLTPMEVVSMLNEMYTKFDKCLELHNVYKVETIGDAYMVVSGLPERTDNHATEIIDMAFDMLGAISTLRNPATGETMMIRIGCHSGPTVAGVVGLKMPRYCLFGDTVNTASRMESNSEAMKIHISEPTKTLLENRSYHIIERGKIDVKGKGEMKTYFVLSRFDKKGIEVKCSLMGVFEEMDTQSRIHKEQQAVIDLEVREQKLIGSDGTSVTKEEKDRSHTPENNIDANYDTKSITENRGYSPVTIEDVRKSMGSLKLRSKSRNSNNTNSSSYQELQKIEADNSNIPINQTPSIPSFSNNNLNTVISTYNKSDNTENTFHNDSSRTNLKNDKSSVITDENKNHNNELDVKNQRRSSIKSNVNLMVSSNKNNESKKTDTLTAPTINTNAHSNSNGYNTNGLSTSNPFSPSYSTGSNYSISNNNASHSGSNTSNNISQNNNTNAKNNSNTNNNNNNNNTKNNSNQNLKNEASAKPITQSSKQAINDIDSSQKPKAQQPPQNKTNEYDYQNNKSTEEKQIPTDANQYNNKKRESINNNNIKTIQLNSLKDLKSLEQTVPTTSNHHNNINTKTQHHYISHNEFNSNTSNYNHNNNNAVANAKTKFNLKSLLCQII